MLSSMFIAPQMILELCKERMFPFAVIVNEPIPQDAKLVSLGINGGIRVNFETAEKLPEQVNPVFEGTTAPYAAVQKMRLRLVEGCSHEELVLLCNEILKSFRYVENLT